MMPYSIYIKVKMKFFSAVMTSCLIFIGCKSKSKINYTYNSHYLTVTDSISANQTISQFIEPYKDSMNREMNQVLNSCKTEMLKERGKSGESLLGNFAADLTLEMGNIYLDSLKDEHAEMALLNIGGLRTSIPQGNITRGKIYELMPFDNKVVAVKLDSLGLRGMLTYLAKKNGDPISGLKISIKNHEITQAKLQGENIDYSKQYWVITTDYLASGGDKMYFFQHRTDFVDLGVLLRDAMIEYLQQKKMNHQPIESSLDGRIIIQ